MALEGCSPSRRVRGAQARPVSGLRAARAAGVSVVHPRSIPHAGKSRRRRLPRCRRRIHPRATAVGCNAATPCYGLKSSSPNACNRFTRVFSAAAVTSCGVFLRCSPSALARGRVQAAACCRGHPVAEPTAKRGVHRGSSPAVSRLPWSTGRRRISASSSTSPSR